MSEMFETVEKTRAHERVVAQIEDRIVSGDLVPGDHLPSERELVEKLDVSRPTVREALRVAESLGLIEVRPGDPRGPVVKARYPKGTARIVAALLRCGKADLGHLVEMRMVLEGQASFLAALRPREELDPLVDALNAIRDADNPKALQAADSAFHEAQGMASGNPLIALIIGALGDSIRLSIAVGLPSLGWPDARTVAFERHSAIVDKILAGDAEGAAKLSRLHLLNTYGALMPDAVHRLHALAHMGEPDVDHAGPPKDRGEEHGERS